MRRRSQLSPTRAHRQNTFTPRTDPRRLSSTHDDSTLAKRDRVDPLVDRAHHACLLVPERQFQPTLDRMADPNNNYGKPAVQELSMSEEIKYKKKCRDLKRRISEIETGNENLVTKLARTKRFIQRARLERAFLLEKLEEKTPRRAYSDGSPSPPASPSLETFSLDPRFLGRADGGSPYSRRSNSPDNSRQHTPPFDQFGYDDADRPSGRSLGGASRLSPPAQGSQKKKREPKDPNAPKRPKNAFLLFCEIERDSIRAAADPGDGETVDIARELGRVWANMNDTSRKPYRDMYEEDRGRYEREMMAYEASKGTVKTEEPAVSKPETTVAEPVASASPAPRVGGFTAVNRS